MADLRARLLLLREATGESQAELGRALGAGQQTVWGWENGRVQPNWRMLGSLADHFGVSVDYLIGRTEDPTPPRRAGGPPRLSRWLRERLVERRLSLGALSEATGVPLAVLLGIQEGTAADVAPAHLRALARHLGAGEEEIIALAPGVSGRGMNPDTGSGVAAASADDLTEEERREMEAFLQRLRRRRGDGAGQARE